jgi:hypothetical protein
VHRCFEARTHRDALRDPPIPPNAKTQVRSNVSQHFFYRNRTKPTRSRKILPQRFMPWMQQNALCDSQIPPDAKIQFRRNVSRLACYGNHTSHPSMKNSALMFHAPECTTCPTYPTGCFPRFSVTCPGGLLNKSVLVLPKHKK